MASQEGATDGAHQNIARASRALDALANSGNDGLRLTDVSRLTGLSKTAAHRCLAGLVAYGMASYDDESSLFFLGDRILAWVGLAEGRFAIADRVKPYLQDVADRSGDTVYFSVRRGDESVCYGRCVGSYPIKTLTLNFGDRRPLGVGSGSLAIMAFLDDAEQERIMRQRAADRSAYPISDGVLQTMIGQARQDGFALMNEYLIPGMSAVGVPIRDRKGAVKAALSVAAITSRIEPPRREELLEYLRSAARRIEDELPELLTAL
jgi:DNA-binding IclR family transcriptional regulator